uniref:Uncharacterized protein n=1 Tax=Wuchereria bancrofti TaxID=6293 RepID=A0AAF5RSZ2_WUCBA
MLKSAFANHDKFNLSGNGQIIVGGCMSNDITGNPLGKCEKTIKFNEQNHVTIDIIGNITAKNEKIKLIKY